MTSPSLTRSPLPTIALVGRANTGKSTLWNKVVERPRALVSDVAHTTRDRNFGLARWRGQSFELVDTGGLDTEENEIGEGIRRQAERAVKEADVIIFLVDGKIGVLPEDREIAKLLRKRKGDVVLAVNKIDNPREFASAADTGIYSLGFGEPVPVSAATGKGVGDLLDETYKRLGDRVQGTENGEHEPSNTSDSSSDTLPPAPGTQTPLRLVLMGRPNVGKSSLVNAILGEERVIVSAIAHTTREPQDTPFTYQGRDMVLVDTAGMRKRSRVERGVEEEGIERNREALKEADIAFLVFDTTEDPKRQDRTLGGIMKGADKGLILVANKWDLVEDKSSNTSNEYEAVIRQLFPFLDWAPMVFVSAKDNLRTKTLLDLALKVHEERLRTIEYNALQRFLKTILKQKRPLASYGPKSPYIHDLAQVGSEPPTFLITIRGEKETVHPNWLKFMEKRLRDKFGFDGTPIVVKSTNVPIAKSERARNMQGPGMEAVAGRVTEKWMVQKKKNVRRRPSGRR